MQASDSEKVWHRSLCQRLRSRDSVRDPGPKEFEKWRPSSRVTPLPPLQRVRLHPDAATSEIYGRILSDPLAIRLQLYRVTCPPYRPGCVWLRPVWQPRRIDCLNSWQLTRMELQEKCQPSLDLMYTICICTLPFWKKIHVPAAEQPETVKRPFSAVSVPFGPIIVCLIFVLVAMARRYVRLHTDGAHFGRSAWLRMRFQEKQSA